MTDHAAEAAEHIEEAIVANRNGAWQTAQFEMKLAQAEATLALAQQQRLGNQIAYATLLELQYAEAARRPEGFVWETHQASVVRHGVVLAQIRDGLGLE